MPSQLRLMCMERRRFSQTMASKWQTAFVVSHKMSWRALLTAINNYNKSFEKLQDFFFKTETKTKTKCSKARLRPHDPRPRPRLSFLSSMCKNCNIFSALRLQQRRIQQQVDEAPACRIIGCKFYASSRALSCPLLQCCSLVQ